MKKVNTTKKIFFFKHVIYKDGISQKTDSLSFGNMALISTQSGVLTSEQLEAARLVIRRSIGKNLKILIKVKPYLAITKKSSGVRMGKGKGAFEKYIFFVKKDEVLFELKTRSKKRIQDALNRASVKLPIICKIISI